MEEACDSKLIKMFKKFQSCIEEIGESISFKYATHVFQDRKKISDVEDVQQIIEIDFKSIESQVSYDKEIVNMYISEAQKELKLWRMNRKSKQEIKRMFEIHGNLQTALNDNNNLIEKLKPIISELKKLETELQFSQNINKVNVNGLETIKNSLKEKKSKMKEGKVEGFIYRDVKLIVRKNNLVEEYTEAIVNPANQELKHEGGAAKAIAQAAGEEFNADCESYLKSYGNLLTGKSMITKAGGTLC
jgi:predicted RNase H-like nuclease (RuvC/YqgF family)